jgi:hypothetical protein
VRWGVQYLRADRKWRLIVNSCSESRTEAVVSLREWRLVSPSPSYEYRLVRLVTKSEKLRAAIVKELRELARGPALVMNALEAQFSAVMLGTRILELADRIERGEVV